MASGVPSVSSFKSTAASSSAGLSLATYNRPCLSLTKQTREAREWCPVGAFSSFYLKISSKLENTFPICGTGLQAVFKFSSIYCFYIYIKESKAGTE